MNNVSRFYHDMIDRINYDKIIHELKNYDAQLVAVSKLKPIEDIQELFNYGQKIFGENYVQELTEKNNLLSKAEWHFIGHLQTNKVKMISGFISLIHGIDSLKLLEEVNKQAVKAERKLECLLQIHISNEKTKFGFTYDEVEMLLDDSRLSALKNVSIKGLMGMASLTEDHTLIRKEFNSLGNYFRKNKSRGFEILSMGMTNDYKIALDEGSNMVRIGSALFGERSTS